MIEILNNVLCGSEPVADVNYAIGSLFIWIALGVGALFVGEIPKMIFNSDKSLLVLGMSFAGKTELYSKILNITRPKDDNGGTSIEDVDSFKFTHKSGKEVTIKAGEEYGGDVSYHLLNIKKITEYDYIFYVFDINEYLNDSKYQLQCHARFDSIDRHRGDKVIYCLASHADICRKNPPEELKIKLGGKLNSKNIDQAICALVNEKLQTKWYKDVVKNLVAIDLTDRSEVLKFAERIKLV